VIAVTAEGLVAITTSDVVGGNTAVPTVAATLTKYRPVVTGAPAAFVPSQVKAIALVVACVPVELFSNSPVAGLVTVTVQLPVAGITAETFTGVGSVTSIKFGVTLTP